ncbi:MAG: HAD-IIA family hydrolase [Bacteroidales bacterium]|jgi:HAD superfamily hydrolase (TIGR01450 family)|nr:HAD-IIA family hydrolase [Bacteroidales bacterium]
MSEIASENEISPCMALRLQKIKHVALDLDGTIYNGNTLFPYTVGFLKDMKEMGIGYTFLTNNPTKSREDYLKSFEKLGFKATMDEIITSSQATILYLKRHRPEIKKLFILGTPSMTGEFARAGFTITSESEEDVPDAVLVSFDKTLSYTRLCRAAWWISMKLPYIATNPDKVCPTDMNTILVDCGSICSALEYATGRKPDLVIGKPEPGMLNIITEKHGLKNDEVAMIGDRVYTDIAMAVRAHALGVLVLSGETSYETGLNADPAPDIILNDLMGFRELMELTHKKQ